MEPQEILKLAQQLSPRKRGRKSQPKQPLDFKTVEDQLRQKYGSLQLALDIAGLSKPAWDKRRLTGLFPTQELPQLQFLLDNDLMSLYGVEVPDDYRHHSIRNSQIPRHQS